MRIKDLKLEVYFGKYEFTAPYLLAQSDCESMTARELLALEPGSEQGYLDQWLGYTETWGDPELRRLTAGLYRTLAPEDVLMLCGAEEGILAYMNVMLSSGDHAIIMTPNYPSAWEAVAAIPGCGWSEWRIHDGGDRWVLDFGELEQALRPNTKLVAVNTPNNPTGYTLSDQELVRLCDFCRAHHLYLFCDEVYHGLELDEKPRAFAADLYEKALSLGVMSKAYGLPGLRVGWAASRDRETLDKMVRFKHYTTICDAAPAEYLSKIALRHSDALLSRCRGIIRDNLKVMDAFFRRHGDLFAVKPVTAGPIAFHKLLNGMGADEFCALAVEKKGVLLLPGSTYDETGPYFRMGFGRKNFPENLQKLEEFLTEQGF